MSALLTAAPVAFVVGVLVGLALCSRYRITKRPPNDKGPEP